MTSSNAAVMATFLGGNKQDSGLTSKHGVESAVSQSSELRPQQPLQSVVVSCKLNGCSVASAFAASIRATASDKWLAQPCKRVAGTLAEYTQCVPSPRQQHCMKSMHASV